MNRRSFLRLLAAVPVLRHVPLPRSVYGDGDGTLTIPGDKTLSLSQWKEYDDVSWDVGGGGGGGGGHIVVVYVKGGLTTISARGGAGPVKGPGEA